MAKAKKSKTNTASSKTKSAILSAIPESIDQMQMLKNAVHLFEEAQKHASDLREEANKELAKFLERMGGSYQQAQKQAKVNLMGLIVSWNEKKHKLPKKLVVEVDRLLDTVGHRMGAMQKSKDRKTTKTVKTKAETSSAKKSPARKSAAKVTKPLVKVESAAVKTPAKKTKTPAVKSSAKAPAKKAESQTQTPVTTTAKV